MKFLKDVVSFTDFEKLVTGTAFSLSVLVALYRYFRFAELHSDMVYLVTSIGGLFIARKVAKYKYEPTASNVSNVDLSVDKDIQG